MEFPSPAEDAQMPTKKVERGITRFDIEERNTHGFMMRICRRGEKVHEFFSDTAYGGKKKALLAARVRYQQLVKQLPEADTAKGKMSVRNTTGVVGVHVAHTILPDFPDKEYFAYCASWKTDAGERQKSVLAGKNMAKEMHSKWLAWPAKKNRPIANESNDY